jgi:hypothetical protein
MNNFRGSYVHFKNTQQRRSSCVKSSLHFSRLLTHNSFSLQWKTDMRLLVAVFDCILIALSLVNIVNSFSLPLIIFSHKFASFSLSLTLHSLTCTCSQFYDVANDVFHSQRMSRVA